MYYVGRACFYLMASLKVQAKTSNNDGIDERVVESLNGTGVPPVNHEAIGDAIDLFFNQLHQRDVARNNEGKEKEESRTGFYTSK